MLAWSHSEHCCYQFVLNVIRDVSKEEKENNVQAIFINDTALFTGYLKGMWEYMHICIPNYS